MVVAEVPGAEFQDGLIIGIDDCFFFFFISCSQYLSIIGTVY